MAAMAALAMATVPAAHFAPVAGQRYRLVVENRPAAGAGAYVFTGEHDLVFVREGPGWTATLTLRHVTASAPPAMARMFEAGQRALIDRPVVFRLDGAGRIIGIDDEEGLIRALAAGIAGAAQDAERRATTKRLAAPLLALSPGARRAFLSSMIAPALAAEDAVRSPAIGRAVTVPAVTPGSTGALLAGTQDVIREATGAIVVRTRAQKSAGDGSRTTLSIERRIDPVHGLLLREEKTVATLPDDPTADPPTSDITIVTLAPVL